MEQIITFEQMLDNISRMSAEEQLMLAEIIKKRIAEQRRKEIAYNVKESLEKYNSGEAKTGSIDDLIKELEDD